MDYRAHLVTLVLLLIVAPVFSNDDPSGEFKFVYGGSKREPFTTALRSEGEARETLTKLGKWFEDTSKDVKRRRELSDGSECTLRGQPWIGEAFKYAYDRNISKIDSSCATRTEHVNLNLTKAIHLLSASAKLFESAGTKAVQQDSELRTNLGRVKEQVYAIKDLVYKKEDQDCSLNYLAAVRVKNKWYIAMAVTDAIPNVGGTRKRFVEHIASDLSAPISMQLSESNYKMNLPGEEWKKANRTPYTTTYAKFSGSSHISRIHRMDYEDNRALNNALETNILAVDQAQDAITPANMAILILPLFMSFIPVALIADLSEIATFFYVLLTDVFAAVPFVIKGVELVITGRTTRENAETWLVGNDDGDQVAETWTAACKPVTKFRTIGIIIIVVGLASILSGILIEHLARKWMSYKRLKGEEPEPFGPALLRMDAYIPVGANYMPVNSNYEDALSPNIAADMPPPPPVAASPVVPSRFSNLFSGLLRRNELRRRRHDEDQHQQQAAGNNQAVGIAPAVLGVRQRGNAQSGGVEYEEAI